jgi:hypothetical protein
MLKDLPYKMEKFHADLSQTNLEDLYGFALAKITAPSEAVLKNPILPYKNKLNSVYSRVYYPKGI